MKYPPRWSVCLFVLLLVVGGITLLSGERASANHPVLVEGNCDSPVPGTTLVTTQGSCGDFDGDGRIGTAEDTDGADRIFGTLNAAIGPGTGAAAGTGANYNGRVIIVQSGRFAEQLILAPVVAVLGNLQIEAAPGVDANIDAVLQGDPAGGNTARQAGVGIYIDWPVGRTVTLRNLTVRNFQTGLIAAIDSRVTIDNCRFDHNQDFGVHLFNQSRLTMNASSIMGSGRRIPVTGPPLPGNGIQFDDNSAGVISNSIIVNSVGAGLQNNSTTAIHTFHLVFADNDGGGAVGVPVIKEDY